MRDEINQNISRLIDEDLGYDETLDLLKKMQTDKMLKAKMARYQMISQALKNEEYFCLRPDFSEKIAQQIQNEPAYFLPQRKPIIPRNFRYYAAAASILAAVLLAAHNSPWRGLQAGSYQVAAIQPQPSATVAVAQNSESQDPQKHQPQLKQFNDYLQAHNSSVYTNGEADFHPYAKMAAYGRE